MAIANFDEAMRRLLAHEGGYVDHPSDPGGPTNYGITLAAYRTFMKPQATAADVRAMRPTEARAIYRAKYWNALRCDRLPAGVDYAAFDYAVNSGPSRAARVLQRVCGVPADGVIDDAVVARVCARDPAQLIAAICDERMAFLRSLKTWGVFGTGWSRRVADVRKAALAMAVAKRQDASVPAQAPKAAIGKGVVPVGKAAQRGATGAVVVGGGAAARQAHEAGFGPAVVLAVVVITIGVALTVWAFWHWRQWRRQLTPALPQS